MLISLLEDLEGMRWSNEEHEWRWNLEENDFYSVTSAYLKSEGLLLAEFRWSEEEKMVFEDMWYSSDPSKVVSLGWRMLHNRIPTRDNIALRNVLPLGASRLCVMCNVKEESTLHLFLHCKVAYEVWLKLMAWLNWWFPIPPNLFTHWVCWSGGGVLKRLPKVFG